MKIKWSILTSLVVAFTVVPLVTSCTIGFGDHNDNNEINDHIGNSEFVTQIKDNKNLLSKLLVKHSTQNFLGSSKNPVLNYGQHKVQQSKVIRESNLSSPTCDITFPYRVNDPDGGIAYSSGSIKYWFDLGSANKIEYIKPQVYKDKYFITHTNFRIVDQKGIQYLVGAFAVMTPSKEFPEGDPRTKAEIQDYQIFELY